MPPDRDAVRRTRAVDMGLKDHGDTMDRKGNRWTVVFAAVSFLAAVAIAAVA
jgi:hypothetical protein